MTRAPGPGGAFITGFFSTAFVLLISPSVALLVMLLEESKGLYAVAGLPDRPKESMDPIRFCRALSASVPPPPPPPGADWSEPARRPLALRLPIVNTTFCPAPLAAEAGVGAA